MAKQDVTVELFYSGVWNDRTDAVYVRDGITITHGRADESGQPAPSSAKLTFGSHEFNPRNPGSPLHGLIGRNTPLRISVGGVLRFWGEVASWTPRRAIKGDQWVLVQASGITRRLGQGADPLRGPIFRETMSEEYDAVRVAYWPCEDESTATEFASPMPGVGPMSFGTGAMNVASYTGFQGSQPLPTVAAGTQPGVDSARGDVPNYAGDFFSRVLLAIPADGFIDGAQMVSILFDGGTIGELEVEYFLPTNGSLHLVVFDHDGVQTDASTTFDASINGDQFLLSVELVQNGADVDYLMFLRFVGADGSTSSIGIDTNTFPGQTLGTAREVRVGGTTTDGLSFGHVMVGNDQSLVFNIAEVLAGWIGETAGRRMERLCAEEGVPFVADGNLDDTPPMGPQQTGTFLALLQTAADLDMGVLQDDRAALGVLYRSRLTLYSQAAALALDHDAGQVAPPLDPVLDDQATRNDITVTRTGGSSFRATLDAGALSTQPPPDGVGRYQESVTVNAARDGQLPGQASWRLHIGTTDETRYPQVTVDLDASPELAATASAVGIGDRLTITNLPAGISPDPVDLLVQGWTETIGSHRRRITFNCTPEEPYHIAEVEHPDYSVIGSDSATVDDVLTTTETDVTINCGAGPRWVHEGVDYDILVGGERMTVTAVSGVSGLFPNEIHILTVIRSVNGVVKEHADGTPIQFFHRSYIGL